LAANQSQATAVAKVENGPLSPTEIMKSAPHAMTELQARFSSDLDNPQAVRQFLGVCLALDLNPFLDEITPYQGKPYIQQAGWMRKVNERAPGQLVKIESGMATTEEKSRYSIPDEDLFAYCDVVRRFPDGNEQPYRAYAQIKREEIGQVRQRDGSLKKSFHRPIDKEPWLMAEKRARVRAVRMVFRDVMGREDNLTDDAGRVNVDQLGDLPMLDAPETGTIEGSSTPAPAASEEVVGDNVKAATDKARREFHQFRKDKGLSQEAAHKLMGLKCTGLHEGDAGVEQNPCHELRDTVAAWQKQGYPGPAAWTRAKTMLERFLRESATGRAEQDAEDRSIEASAPTSGEEEIQLD
jgi:hypothetical protein